MRFFVGGRSFAPSGLGHVACGTTACAPSTSSGQAVGCIPAPLRGSRRGCRFCWGPFFRPFGLGHVACGTPRVRPLRQAQGRLWAAVLRRSAARVVDAAFAGARSFAPSSVREKLCRPYRTRARFPLSPGLASWANVFRRSAAGVWDFAPPSTANSSSHAHTSGLGHAVCGTHGLRPFDKLRASCGLQSCAASRLASWTSLLLARNPNHWQVVWGLIPI